jgi:alpha-galactosidase
VTSSHAVAGSSGGPVWLQLARTGADSYTGAFSTASAQGPWTAVGSVTVDPSAAADAQDVGLFAASGSAGSPALAGFTGFTVTG